MEDSFCLSSLTGALHGNASYWSRISNVINFARQYKAAILSGELKNFPEAFFDGYEVVLDIAPDGSSANLFLNPCEVGESIQLSFLRGRATILKSKFRDGAIDCAFHLLKCSDENMLAFGSDTEALISSLRLNTRGGNSKFGDIDYCKCIPREFRHTYDIKYYPETSEYFPSYILTSKKFNSSYQVDFCSDKVIVKYEATWTSFVYTFAY